MATIFPLREQMGFRPFLDLVVDSPDGRPQSPLLGHQFDDIRILEFPESSEILENPVFTEDRAMFAVVIEFREDRPVLHEIIDCLPSSRETFLEGRTIEEPFVSPEVFVVGGYFVCSEDFQLRRTIGIAQEGEVVPEPPAGNRGRRRISILDPGHGAQFLDQQRPIFRRIQPYEGGKSSVLAESRKEQEA